MSGSNKAVSPFEPLNHQFIGGQWVDGNGTGRIDIFNPYTADLIRTFQGADQKQVDEAYIQAKKASVSWAALPFPERRRYLERALEVLYKNKDEIVDTLIDEVGSTNIKANIEVGLAIDIFKQGIAVSANHHGYIYPSSVSGKESRAYRKPLGVITIISPWNFPLVLSLRSVVYAIALGNTVVLKPAPQSPLSGGNIIAYLFREAGLPAGVLNVVIGTNDEIGDYMVEHPVSRLISFTGSTGVGRHIGALCGKHLKRVALELGGNNVFIVRNDADLAYAVKAGVFGRFLHQGQICMSVNRFLIHEDIYDEFCHQFIETVRTLRYGDPKDPSVFVGPLISKKQIDKILGWIAASLSEGAVLALGGDVDGQVLSPTVIVHANNQMPIAVNEIFGPVAVMIPFKDDEDAIRMANDSPNGLSGALHTKDLDYGVRMATRIETGMIHVNDQPINDEPHAIFGGEKASGLGRFNGDYIIDEFTTMQWVTVQYEPREYPL